MTCLLCLRRVASYDCSKELVITTANINVRCRRQDDRKSQERKRGWKSPLVKRYYEGDPKTGEKPGYLQTPAERKASANDRTRMQPATKAEQNSQGGQMSQYSKEQKKRHGL